MLKVTLNLWKRYNKAGNMLLASISGNRNGKNDGLEFRHHTCVIESIDWYWEGSSGSFLYATDGSTAGRKVKKSGRRAERRGKNRWK